MRPIIERTCREYQRMLAAGEEQADVISWLAEEAGVNRPAIWKRLRSGGVLPGYKKAAHRPYKRTSQEPFIARPLPPRIDRDPCPRRGTRRDIGCEHQPCRLGMVL